MVIFNHLISWHNEQIATSRKWRPRETKQREAALPLIKKVNLIMFVCVCVRVCVCGGGGGGGGGACLYVRSWIHAYM